MHMQMSYIKQTLVGKHLQIGCLPPFLCLLFQTCMIVQLSRQKLILHGDTEIGQRV